MAVGATKMVTMGIRTVVGAIKWWLGHQNGDWGIKMVVGGIKMVAGGIKMVVGGIRMEVGGMEMVVGAIKWWWGASKWWLGQYNGGWGQ